MFIYIFHQTKLWLKSLQTPCRSVDWLRECGVYTQQLHSRSIALYIK